MKSVLLAVALLLGPQGDPDSLSENATRLAQEKRYDEAAALWQAALKIEPGHFPALFNLGYMPFTRARFREAEPFLARAAAAKPDDFNTRYLLGNTLVGLGRGEDGLRQWRAALALQPRNAKLMQVMAVEYSKGRYFAEAAALARRALELSPGDLNAHLVAIKACQDAGERTAIEIARRAVEKFPASARANFEYGFHLQRVGQTEKSLPYLKKAIAADPKYEEPLFFYGDLLLKQGRDEEAIPYLRKALGNRPDYVAAAVALARALMSLERYQEAVQELQRALTRQPKHPQPHLLLSQIYFRLGDEKRAGQEKEISLRLRRADPAIMESPQGRPFPAGAK
jgi:tetratricopeptide (TPR) repeat protein